MSFMATREHESQSGENSRLTEAPFARARCYAPPLARSSPRARDSGGALPSLLYYGSVGGVMREEKEKVCTHHTPSKQACTQVHLPASNSTILSGSENVWRPGGHDLCHD